MSCTLAWPHATAWQNANSSVRLQRMPSRCSSAAAWMPSQVEAILISTRSHGMPCASYSAMMRRARATVAAVSKLRRASTSVDTRPGMVFKISQPKRTNRWSITTSSGWPRCAATASASRGAYSGFCTAFKIKDGLVVASCGWNWANCLKSPVSATTVVNCLRASSWFMGAFQNRLELSMKQSYITNQFFM